MVLAINGKLVMKILSVLLASTFKNKMSRYMRLG